MKILFIGDIVGKIGRQAVAKVLPNLKKELKPDLVIANAENLAHGKAVTADVLNEMISAGIDFFTSGNHIWKKKESIQILSENKLPIIRPANYPPNVPGDGYRLLEVGSKKILIINLVGRVFMKEDFDCPFRKLEEILKAVKSKKPNFILVDFHAEVTSESRALGFYADEQMNHETQVSAVVGTHTHIQTADEQILTNGTGYITDVGMVGAKDSVLGVDKQVVIRKFLTQISAEHDIPESGICIFNSIYLEIDNTTGKTTKIERVNREAVVG